MTTTVRPLSLGEGLDHLAEGGTALIDLRPVEAYLESHIPKSLALVYEFGPGLPGRARDCLPLDLRLVLLDPGDLDLGNAAAALRGKGFTVVGAIDDPLDAWSQAGEELRSTEVIGAHDVPSGLVLDVGDPGASPPNETASIPIERLYGRVEELDGNCSITLAAGYGVRAALAVGILERHEVEEILFWRTRG
ncbi:MAG: rhodanese-like domain-containing protein [Actinomycetota bacterium]|nr:rhodanese-like domain-containing protein [Actinomycetota bacterium]